MVASVNRPLAKTICLHSKLCDIMKCKKVRVLWKILEIVGLRPVSLHDVPFCVFLLGFAEFPNMRSFVLVETDIVYVCDPSSCFLV